MGSFFSVASRSCLVDLSNGVGHVPGRSRVWFVGLSKLDGIVHHVVFGLVLVVVGPGLRYLVLLLVEDFPDGDSSAFAGPAPVQEIFEAPTVPVRLSFLDESECTHEFGLQSLSIGKDVPALAPFFVGVILEVEDGPHHDGLVESDGFDGLVERPHHDDIVEGDGFFGFVLDRFCLVIVFFNVFRWFRWFRWR